MRCVSGVRLDKPEGREERLSGGKKILDQAPLIAGKGLTEKSHEGKNAMRSTPDHRLERKKRM